MIKKLMTCVREYKTPSILAALFMVGEVLMEVLIPYFMANMIDFGFANENLSYVYEAGAKMLLIICAGLVFGVLSGKCAATASAGLAKNLRKDMYYNIQGFSFQNIDSFSTASLVTRLTTDVTNVQNAYQMIIRLLVRAPIMLIMSLIMSFTLNARLTWIFVGTIPFLTIVLLVLVRFSYPIFMKLFKEYDHLNAVVQENLTGVRTVKAYVREEEEIAKFNKVSDMIVKLGKKAEKYIVFAFPAMFLAMFFCIIASSYFGAHMIIAEEMTTGVLMSVITYAMQILMSLMMACMILVMCVMARASAERITEVLKEKSLLTNPKDPVYQVPNGEIQFENVSFGYNDGEDKVVLDKIDLTIHSGETIGIIGGTGSSKSSLVQLIPRLYDVSKGTLKVGGVDVAQYDIEALRNEVSMVLQKNVLFTGTIKENLRWGNKDATDEEIMKACEQAQAAEFIEKFEDGYDTMIEQGGTNVSGGQKQRLCIARALLKKPKILILDDSTSAVDTKTDALIRKAFKETIPDTTKLIIAQRISSVKDADRIIVLNEGKIHGIGTHKELIQTDEIYQEVFDSQEKGGEENAESEK